MDFVMKTAKVRVSVTQAQIDGCVKLSPCFCPVAVAINLVMKSQYYASVYRNMIVINSKSQDIARITPTEEVYDFIGLLDKGLPVPFEFDIELPEVVVKQEEIK
jgi:hypothetical protein